MRQIKPTIHVAILLAVFFSSQNVMAQAAAPISSTVIYSVSLHRDDKMDSQHAQFFKNNPNVLLLHWKKEGGILQIYLRENIVEQYDLWKEAELVKAEKKYGKLPSKAAGSYS